MSSLLIQATVFWAMVVGPPLGIAMAATLLWLFRRRVAQSMRKTARTTPASSPERQSPELGPTSTCERAPAKERPVIEFARPEVALADSTATSPDAAARRQAWRVAVVYVAAATAAALVIANSVRIIASAGPPAGGEVLWYVLYFAAFPLVFATPAILAGVYVFRKHFLHLLLAVLASLVILGIWDLFFFEGALLRQWLWFCAIPTVIALLLSMRRLRTVGPVAAIAATAWTGVTFGLMIGFFWYSLDWLGVRMIRPELQDPNPLVALLKYFGESLEGSPAEKLRQLPQIHRILGDDLLGGGRVFTVERIVSERAANVAIGVMVLIALAGGALAAWAIVSWLASRYRRRRASDQMRTIDSFALVAQLYLFTYFALFSVGIDGEFDRRWAAAALLVVFAFVAYKLASAVGLRFLRTAHGRAPPRTLLLLRVFGFDRRTQRLLDDLGQRWRYLGPIELIAGADLAYATVQPSEFYGFLSGRLRRAFIEDRRDLERRLSRTAAVADPDGLYRLEDFFCYDDTWRMTVTALARAADAVFMDVRGFSSGNRGCVFEIEQLIAWAPMERIVLLVDETTDLPLLDRTLAEAWRRLPEGSPNALLAQPVVRALRASRHYWKTLNALMAMLCARVDGSPRAQPATATA